MNPSKKIIVHSCVVLNKRTLRETYCLIRHVHFGYLYENNNYGLGMNIHFTIECPFRRSSHFWKLIPAEGGTFFIINKQTK